jgi:SulP family sulfate permease
LAQEAEAQRAAGGALYLCNLKPTVVDVLERAGLIERIGRDRIFATKDEAIRGIYPRLDSAICRASTARIFIECQSHLPDGSPRHAG